MNFNLISPKDNGHKYNIRFQENIKIPKNSQVYLNYASFTRNSNIYFTKDQTLNLTNMVLAPSHLPGTPSTQNQPSTKSITIPAINTATGKKSWKFEELLEFIADTIDNDIIGGNGNKLDLYKGIDLTDIGNISEFLGDDNSILGLKYDPNELASEEFTIDTNNARNADSGAGVPHEGVYFKNSATGVGNAKGYDSYALSTTHFNHYKSNAFNRGSVIHFATNIQHDQQAGGIFLGLYSKEYIDIGTNWVNRTGGTGATTPSGATNNPVVFRNANEIASGNADFPVATPGAFLSVEITPTTTVSGQNRQQGTQDLNSKIILRLAYQGNTHKFPRTWPDINQNIQNMRILHVEDIDATEALHNIHCQLELYVDILNGEQHFNNNQRKVFFRLYKSSDAITSGVGTLIYDSKDNNEFFPEAFFSGLAVTGSDTEKGNILNSQIPFNIMCSAQALNEGFRYVDFPQIDKTSVGYDADPISILKQYKINATDELSYVLGVASSNNIFPCWTKDFNGGLIVKDDTDQWQNESYSVYINNLPIKNYKNNENVNNGGFSKAIIANIPAPFQYVSVDETTDGEELTTGIYQPSQRVTHQLNNQEMNINNFDVEIRHLKDDIIADQIKNSNISFTII